MSWLYNYFFEKIGWGSCLLCQDPTGRQLDLCTVCEKDLPYLTHCCIQCALPLPADNKNKYCGICLKTARPQLYSLSALFVYKPPINRLIINLKFKYHLTSAMILGQLMANKMKQVYTVDRSCPDLIIPVPLHVSRLRKRGFNQAVELARPISKALSIKLDYYNCFRIRNTLSQTSLSQKERIQNLKNAFLIHPVFQDKHICVIDDVLTTGSTIDAFTNALFEMGVRRIDVWCCAESKYFSDK